MLYYNHVYANVQLIPVQKSLCGQQPCWYLLLIKGTR